MLILRLLAPIFYNLFIFSSQFCQNLLNILWLHKRTLLHTNVADDFQLLLIVIYLLAEFSLNERTQFYSNNATSENSRLYLMRFFSTCGA